MDDNKVECKGIKSAFTVSRVIRLLLLICIIFVFCPMFLVSCSGQEIDISAMTVVKGIKLYGETVVKPNPIMLICLLIPVVAFLILKKKKFTDKKSSLYAMVCMAIDFAVWIVFKTSASNIAKENYCSFDVTVWYYINLIIIVVIVTLTFMVANEKLKYDTDLLLLLTGDSRQQVLDQLNNTVEKMSNTVNMMVANVTEEMESVTEIQKKEKNESHKDTGVTDTNFMFCEQCGAKIDSDSVFCAECGSEVK